MNIRSVRLRLTAMYSGWFLAALIAILVIIYLFFRFAIYSDLNDALKAYQNQADGEFTSRLTPDEGRDPYKSAVGFFEFTTDVNKNIAYSSGFFRQIWPDIHNRLPEPGDGVVRLRIKTGTEDLHIALLSSAIIKNGKEAGTLYVGKNMTKEHERLEKIFLVLLVLGIIFFGLSMLIGDRLARKALKPIEENIARERRFSANASHELKTPLAVLLSSVEVLETTEEPTAEGEKMLQDMKDEIGYMKKLTTDLLELARYGHNKINVKKEELDLNRLIAQLVERFQRIYHGKSIEIKFTADADASVNADPVKIEQLVYILIDNAIKHSRPPRNVAINITAGKKSTVHLSVADSGLGIPAEDLAYIFEPFYRIDKSHRRKTGGTGLGLALARAIVDAHQGTINVQSTPAGTVFMMELPRK